MDIDYPAPRGSKPRLEYHAPDTLVVDERYQRGIGSFRSKALINNILHNWNWNFFGTILATDNGDGTYCVIDGQHRAEAARRHPAIHSVPVMVIDEMTLAEQAQAFTAINQVRVSLNPLQIHRAKVTAGDEHARAIASICASVGVTVPNNVPTGGATRPGELLCISTLYKIFSRHGAAILHRTLSLCMAAYPESAGDMRAQIVQAVCLATTATSASDAEIVNRLGSKDALSWLEMARKESGNTVATLARLLAGVELKAAGA